MPGINIPDTYEYSIGGRRTTRAGGGGGGGLKKTGEGYCGAISTGGMDRWNRLVLRTPNKERPRTNTTHQALGFVGGYLHPLDSVAR